MFLRGFLLFVVAAAGPAAYQAAHAQPVRGCPDGQAVQALHPNGTPVQCVPVPPPVDLGPVLQAIQQESAELQAAVKALAESQSGPITRCYAAHFVRGATGQDEIRFTVIFFNNGDLENAAVIDRLTIRDDQGVVLHDSGPESPNGTPHPLATAANPPQNITTVPPGGMFGLSTSDIWGFNNIPQYVGKGTRSISVTVEVSKAGDPKLLRVHTREIARQRFFGPQPPFPFMGLGEERAGNQTACFSVPRN